MRRTVLLIDDKPDELEILVATLKHESDFATISTTDPRHALELVHSKAPDAVVTDLVMPGLSGVELTRTLRFEYPSLPIIVLTGRREPEVAEEAFRAGATDFMTKPPETGSLIARLRHAIEGAPARKLLHEATRQRFDAQSILGSHPRVDQVRSFVQQVASVPRVAALILGESGTGKNLVARAIHTNSPHAGYRFVEVNCAALPANLLEAELFGYEKGAFTDARQTKKGLAEVADGGTLFLDEIGTLTSDVQAKLLTFLESRTFRRIGSTEDITVELRVVAATNSDLEASVRDGSFREDLYYRLNVANIRLPALREIREDVPVLAHHFVRKAAEYFRKPLPQVSEDSLRRLQTYDWPGNARELRNVIERAMIFSKGGRLEIQAPEGFVRESADAASVADGLLLPLSLTLDQVERRYIEAVLDDAGGNMGETAERLGVTRKVFWARRRKHGMLGPED